jgi:hypothetical protein
VGNTKSCVAFWTIGSPLFHATNVRASSECDRYKNMCEDDLVPLHGDCGRRGPPHLHGRFHSWQFAALRMGQLVLPDKQNIRKR